MLNITRGRLGISLVLVGMLLTLPTFAGTAGAEGDNPTPLVSICHLADGDPFDYWTVLEVDQVTADWYLAGNPDSYVLNGQNSCNANPPVRLCHLNGSVYNGIETDVADGNHHFKIHAGDVLKNNGTCPVAVCHLDSTDAFPTRTVLYVDQATADWYVSINAADFILDGSNSCAPSDLATICHNSGSGYELVTDSGEAANFHLAKHDGDKLPNADGTCKTALISVPTVDPTPAPTVSPAPDIDDVKGETITQVPVPVAQAGAPAAQLPVTGVNTGVIAGLGLLMIAIGVGLVRTPRAT